MIDLFVIFGGQSPEHDVSLQSGINVLNSADVSKYNIFGIYIRKDGKWSIFKRDNPLELKGLQSKLEDLEAYSPGYILLNYVEKSNKKVVFPMIHGPQGEDGTLQGMLEILHIPFVGCGVTSSAIGMDKAIMKTMVQRMDIPIAPYISIEQIDYFSKGESIIMDVENDIDYPCFVKPARGGSSLGISCATNGIELKRAIDKAFEFDNKIIVEKAIEGREIEIGLLGNEEVICSLPGEFVRKPSFFDFEAKYLDEKLAMLIPAHITQPIYTLMSEYASRIYKELECRGLSRADFFLTKSGEVYFNEINTVPGFTRFSMYPSLWERTNNLKIDKLIDRLVKLALERYQSDKARKEKG